MKKFIAVLLTLATLLTLEIPVSAATITGSCGDNADWTLNGDTLTISGTGPLDSWNTWDDYRKQIRKVIIEEGITAIGYCTFAYHTNLEDVALPDSLTTIGGQAFQGSDKLTIITLPKNVQHFYSTQSVCHAASVFSCDNLTAIEVHPENQWFCDVDGVLFDKEMHTLLCYPLGRTETHYTIPSGVKELAHSAFSHSRCTIDLPNSLQIIGRSAFYSADFCNISIPNGVTQIHQYAFENCDFLTEITLPSSVEKVWRDAFVSCDRLDCITFENPDCAIQNSPQALTSDTTVKGYLGSTAETYAKRFGRNFIDLETGMLYEYDTGNAGFLNLLPTNITASVPTFCGITNYSYATGETTGYQPNLVLETNTDIPEYQEMLSFVNNLTSGCSTDYEKAKVISKWVTDNMTYQFGLSGYGHTAKGVYKLFKNLVGNCECYTQLTNFMLHLAGIPNATATSYDHCWSLALLDGRWVQIDSTNGLFDGPEAYYGDIYQIVFSPDGEIVCIIDDLLDVKLTSYGLSISDNFTFQQITIPDYVTYIYGDTFNLRKNKEGNPYVTIHGSVGSYAHEYVMKNLPDYLVSANGSKFTAVYHSHRFEWHNPIPATCTTPGTKGHYTCSDCGKLFTYAGSKYEVSAQSLTIPTSEHSFRALCRNDTSHWWACSCGATSGAENHNYGQWTIITAATENRTGIRQRICSECGYVETQQIPSHNSDNAVGNTAITQMGHNLSYEDLIYVINIFNLAGIEGIDLDKDAGLLIWTVEEFEALDKIAFDPDHANPGLKPYRNTDYYYGSSEGILTRDLRKEAYYVGYIKLADGSYVYSEPKLYSPAIYAYNMLSKSSTSEETKELCVALLNYISAAQMYFDKATPAADLVNADLTDEQKALNWENLSFNLAPEIPADKQVDRDTDVFTDTGKNLLFEEMISIVALYRIDNEVINNAVDCGTIFWTAEQFAALNGAPSIDNIGAGTKTGMSVYCNTPGQWYAQAPEVAAKNMADTQYYYLGYVIHSDGTVSYAGVQSYTVEQYIFNTVAKESTSAEMRAFAQWLYVYERAAKDAIA